MGAIFLCGTLCRDAVLHALFGHAPDAGEAAEWRDRAAVLPPGGWQIAARQMRGASVPGRLFVAPGDGVLARLHHLARALGLGARRITVTRADGGRVAARAWFAPDAAEAQPWPVGGDGGTLGDALMQELLALQGVSPAPVLAARLDAVALRAASRLRAGAVPAASLRRPVADGAADVEVEARREVYANFFSVEEYDLRFRRFDGTMSGLTTRASFISGDAVTVLPYDPGRDRVLLVEQFRAGPFARGARNPWSLEAVAGRIDPGETPEDAARREAVEEAGLYLGRLLPVVGYYPTPGAKSEYIYSYLGLVDLPDDAAGVFGVEGEVEDIRGHLIPRARLMELVASGEIDNAPLILTTFWLERVWRDLRDAA